MRLSDRTAYSLLRLLQIGVVVLLAWIGWALQLAKLDQAGPNVLKVPVRINQDVESHLYYDVGQGLWAGHVVIQQLSGAVEWRVLSFPLPREPVRALRFDPMLTPGQFGIKAPWLESRTGRVIAKFPHSAVTPRHQIAGWRDTGGYYEGITWADADDAQVQFELGWPLRVGSPCWPWIEGGILALILVAIWGLLQHPGNGARARWRTTLRRVFSRSPNVVKSWARWGLTSYLNNSRGWVWAGALVVVVAQGWILRGLDETLDLPMWDESNYAARGIDWAKAGGALGDLHTGPALVISYAGLATLGAADEIVFWQNYLVKMGGTLGLYFLLVKWWRRWPIALAVALAWACSWFQTAYPLLVYQAGWMWFLVAVIVIDRWALLGLVLMAWTVGFRQDYQFALPVVLAAMAWKWWRTRSTTVSPSQVGAGRLERRVVWVAVGVGVVGLAWVSQSVGFRGVGERGWFAFQQHYALRAVHTGEVGGINPLADYPRVMAQDFPGATSLSEALRVNPQAMWRHVRWNVQQAAVEVVKLWRPQTQLVMAFMMLLAAALVGVLIDGQSRSWRWKDEWTEGPGLALAAGALLVVGPGMIVLAKGPYLLPLVPIWLYIFAGLVRLVARRIPLMDRQNAAGVGLGALGLGLVLVATAPPVFDPEDAHRPVKDTLLVLREIWPAEGQYSLIAYGGSSYANYLGHDRCVGIEPINAVTGSNEPNRSLEDLLAQEQPWAILVGSDWRNSSPVDERLLADWSKRELATGTLYWQTL
jgi:hypothetical protein